MRLIAKGSGSKLATLAKDKFMFLFLIESIFIRRPLSSKNKTHYNNANANRQDGLLFCVKNKISKLEMN